MSCHRLISCILQTSHVYIYLVTDTAVVSYRHHTSIYVLLQTHQLCLTDITPPTYVLSQKQQLCLTDITHLHMSSNGHLSCVLQTSHAYKYLVKDTTIVSYRHHTPTYVLSQTNPLCLIDITHLHLSYQTHQLCPTDITHLHMSCQRHSNCVLEIPNA
jgi:hypothetical protein